MCKVNEPVSIDYLIMSDGWWSPVHPDVPRTEMRTLEDGVTSMSNLGGVIGNTVERSVLECKRQATPPSLCQLWYRTAKKWNFATISWPWILLSCSLWTHKNVLNTGNILGAFVHEAVLYRAQSPIGTLVFPLMNPTFACKPTVLHLTPLPFKTRNQSINLDLETVSPQMDTLL